MDQDTCSYLVNWRGSRYLCLEIISIQTSNICSNARKRTSRVSEERMQMGLVVKTHQIFFIWQNCCFVVVGTRFGVVWGHSCLIVGGHFPPRGMLPSLISQKWHFCELCRRTWHYKMVFTWLSPAGHWINRLNGEKKNLFLSSWQAAGNVYNVRTKDKPANVHFCLWVEFEE